MDRVTNVEVLERGNKTEKKTKRMDATRKIVETDYRSIRR